MHEPMVAAYQVGDRVQIHSDVTTPLPLPGNVGTVREVVPCYGDNTVGYNVHIDDDARPNRVWFFLEQQVTPVAAARAVAEEPQS